RRYQRSRRGSPARSCLGGRRRGPRAGSAQPATAQSASASLPRVGATLAKTTERPPELAPEAAQICDWTVYFDVTTNTLNSGPVLGARLVIPIGTGGGTAVIGILTLPPPYVPVATGVPKRSWTFEMASVAPGLRTPDRSTDTAPRPAQLYAAI